MSTQPAKSLDKFDKGDSISDYFYGLLSFNENQYEESFEFLRKLDGLEISHPDYSVKYLYSLINSGNVREAFNYSKKLEKKNLANFESYLVTGVFYLKNSNLDLAKKYLFKAKNMNPSSILNYYVSSSLYNWASVTGLNSSQASLELKKLDDRFENLKKIQNVFLKCFFNSPDTENFFETLISNQKIDFSRYNYFYASYLVSLSRIDEAKQVINSSLKYYPRNLLLNQFKIDLYNKSNVFMFDCKNEQHVSAEILYITANALSSQSMLSFSNFYLNLAKYLNTDFHSYDTLLAENYYKTDNFDKAKKIYKRIKNKGGAFNWYSSKQLARIYLKQEDQNRALNLLANAYKSIQNKNIYETFDYAEFLKNNEKFEESITFYSKILKQIKKDHPLYPEATDGRGVAYERIGQWEKAEKDLLESLKSDPEQAYVINYLAYSWIEQGINIKKSLSMLEKANKLKLNDPFIIDSLGWALFKLERFEESKEYLQLAVKLMPGDPIVNDHYGDVLWKNGNKIQARYYWKYALKLEKAEEKLKKTIQEKLIQGL